MKQHQWEELSNYFFRHFLLLTATTLISCTAAAMNVFDNFLAISLTPDNSQLRRKQSISSSAHGGDVRTLNKVGCENSALTL